MSARCANGHLLGAVETCSSCLASREPTAHDLTPSEVALARVLAAWEAWPNDDGSDAWSTMGAVHVALFEDDWITDAGLTGRSKSLLARARKAGVL